MSQDTRAWSRRSDSEKYVIAAGEPDTWQRMVEKTRFDGPDGCWPWIGRVNADGYGLIAATINGRATTLLAHRLALHVARRPIAAGLVPDHTCHNADASCLGNSECMHRRCVNPAHLDIVTHVENVMRGNSPIAMNARKTHCKHGHEFTPQNTRIRREGTRVCITCTLVRSAAA